MPCTINGKAMASGLASSVRLARMVQDTADARKAIVATMRASIRARAQITSGVSSTAAMPVGAVTRPAQVAVWAHMGLQPERHQQHVGEENAVAQAEDQRSQGEIREPEKREVDDRMLLGQFPDQEQQKPTTETMARMTIMSEANQSAFLPRSSMICSAPAHSTSRPIPIASVETLTVSVSRDLRLNQHSSVTAAPTGTLIRNIQPQK